MKAQWNLQWSEDGVVIVLKPEEKESVKLTGLIGTEDEFIKAINQLTEELKKLMERGLEEFKARQARQSATVKSPEEIWKSFRTMTDEEMISHFNKLEEGLRRSVADYVFSHVSTFSGKGLVFAQLYDHDSATLLEE